MSDLKKKAVDFCSSCKEMDEGIEEELALIATGVEEDVEIFSEVAPDQVEEFKEAVDDLSEASRKMTRSAKYLEARLKEHFEITDEEVE